ncbi:MAG TPA: DUF6338 family protein [Stellaceae bacterium]|nr:DUF6338 family protein [Stellaceae bacterium]
MKIDLLFVQLAIIFLPGLIWAGLDSRYARKSKSSEFHYVLRAFLFGMASYGVTFGLFAVFGRPFSLADFSDAATKGVFTRAIFLDIAAGTLVGLLLAILWLYNSKYKLGTQFLQKIRATKTYGDEDVWDFTFNSAIAAVEYVHFRDFTNKIVYAGWVNEFSESEKLRELVLRDVRVYDFEGRFLFEMPLIYVARNPENPYRISISTEDFRCLTQKPRGMATQRHRF